MHRSLFDPERALPKKLAYFDQTLLNYMAVANSIPVADLGIAFNYMTIVLGRGRLGRVLMNDVFRGLPLIPFAYQVTPEPLNAFMVHLAGYSTATKIRLAKKILSAWSRGEYSTISDTHRRLNRVFRGLILEVSPAMPVFTDELSETVWRASDGVHRLGDLFDDLARIYPQHRRSALWTKVRATVNDGLRDGSLRSVNQLS
jgi:hypothetical protein